MNAEPSYDRLKTVESPPGRYVLPLVEAGGMVWRLVVQRADVAHVRELMAAADVVLPEDVRGWFREHAPRWPVPADCAELSAFIDAFNVLRVTRSKTVRELQTATPDKVRTAARSKCLREAIDVIDAYMPDFVVRLRLGGALQHEESSVLARLAAAAHEAKGIIPTPPRQEAPWHDAAQLIEWHVRRLLALGGVIDPGDGWNGPVVKIVASGLQRTEKGFEPYAVAKALQRAAAATKRILAREDVERMNRGRFVVAA